MKQQRIICAMLGSMLACCASLAAHAQEMGYWRAASSTAKSVTGDVAFSDARMMIYFSTFPTVQARDLAPGEVSAVFDVDSNSNAKGHLYKVSVPATKKFQHKSTLCGSEDTQWMATYVEGNSLNLAFFSGQKPPTFTLDAISNSPNLCGTYTYTR
jgi:hypothetical protein